MAFDGSEGKEIRISTAAGYTAAYREANPEDTKGHFFGKDILDILLSQQDCMGLRIYYGLNNGAKELVIAGANSDEDDIIGKIADASVPCPPSCGVANDLNS